MLKKTIKEGPSTTKYATYALSSLFTTYTLFGIPIYIREVPAQLVHQYPHLI